MIKEVCNNREVVPIGRQRYIRGVAVEIFRELSRKYSLSYLADVADNFQIKRGVNLLHKIEKNGLRVYSYIFRKDDGREEHVKLKGDNEIELLSKELFGLIYKEKKRRERISGRRIIL